MARTLPLPPPGFDDLSEDEKLVYVQALWNRIEASREDEPIPDWHLEIVRERLAEHRAHPEAVLPWEEVRDELLRELRERKTDR
jgi:putative addiction module component (TIGR02574 family)